MAEIVGTKNKITPCLWFNNQAEEAVELYCSLFENSKIMATTLYRKNEQMPEGLVRTISFQLENQMFLALNGGDVFKFTEAISFMVNCDTQDEIDMFWNKLSDGGQEMQCGWLKDKFGVTWQIIPAQLGQLMTSKHAGKIMTALLKMVKIDINVLNELNKE
jgi:predicted 3-demethylubiquinone-9 3-methyltransferase (glyoxalase superfamily)